MGGMSVVGIHFFAIINREIPTSDVINITYGIGIGFTKVMLKY